MSSTRIEKDFLGTKEIPTDAYYGVHTVRALDNSMVSGVPICHFPRFIIALAMVKKASMAANLESACCLRTRHRRSERRATTS